MGPCGSLTRCKNTGSGGSTHRRSSQKRPPGTLCCAPPHQPRANALTGRRLGTAAAHIFPHLSQPFRRTRWVFFLYCDDLQPRNLCPFQCALFCMHPSMHTQASNNHCAALLTSIAVCCRFFQHGAATAAAAAAANRCYAAAADAPADAHSLPAPRRRVRLTPRIPAAHCSCRWRAVAHRLCAHPQGTCAQK
jgi:hypothetical protein